MKITRGIRRTPTRVVIHGVEGIGKSTLAAQFPRPIVLDTEDGTNHLDVARVTCSDWATLKAALVEITGDTQGFQTLVVDSVDWAERLLIEKLLKDSNKRSIEDFGFGKGYVHVAEAMSRLLDELDMVVAKGMNVVLVAHTKVARTSPPDMDEGYDRFELKLTKQAGPLVKEWADAILFANYKTRLVEGQDGRTRAKGGKERVLHTERTAAWDAKNRCGLPPEIPMEIEALAPMLSGTTSSPARTGWLDRVRAATTADELQAIGHDADRSVTAGDLTESQRNKLDAEIKQRAAQLDPEEIPA